MTERPPGPAPGNPLDLAAVRAFYAAEKLLEDQVHDHPLGQFGRWFAAARDTGPDGGVPEPNAMVLSTVDAGGTPSSRTVLLKAVDARGFVFFTNYTSRKAAQLDGDPRVSLCFPWYGLRRQICVLGVAARVPAAESAAYFVTRPWESRIGAWASHQSSPATGRRQLDDAWAAIAQRWPDRGGEDDVPVPPFWGGYVVAATEVEFWQGRSGRLHDRLVYLSRTGEPGRLDVPDDWRIERRQP